LQTLFIFAFSHTCQEPEALPTLLITPDDITEESRWIIPGNLPNNNFIQFANNVTYETIYRLGSCNDYIQRTHHSATEPISTGSTCPWYYVKNIDSNRIPRVIAFLGMCLRWYHKLQVKFDLLVTFSYFFCSMFEYIHCNKYQNFNKFQPTDSEL
jgi:hypothetical protein